MTPFPRFHRSARAAAVFLALGAALALGACSSANDAASTGPDSEPPTTAGPPATVVEGPDVLATLRESGQFGMALELIEASGLVNALPGSGPWTFFLPTDDAFATLGEDELASLRSDPDRVRALLLDHVAEGVYTAESLPTLAGFTINSAAGQPLSFADSGGRLVLVGAGEGEILVIPQGITGSNGVIHGIDRVIFRQG